LKWTSEIPPPPPFFKGGNGGISTEAFLRKEKEMQRNRVAFFKNLYAPPRAKRIFFAK
jgi:hypothetical protein